MTTPTDGRITSLNTFTGTLASSDLFVVVSPGNASEGVNYAITANTLATNIFPILQFGPGTVWGNRTTGTTGATALVNPILGAPGTTAGTLGLAAATTGGAVVVIGNPLATAAYSFNLPTVPGTVGAIFLSGGGAAAAPNTWGLLGSTIIGGTGIAVSGSTVATVSFSTAPGLSVIGVAGTATAVPLPIIGAAGQVLVVNAGATALSFQTATSIAPPPFQTSSLTQFGVVFGNGSSAVSATQAGTSGTILIGQGSSAAPLFNVVSGDLVMSSFGTATITTNSISSAKIATNAVDFTKFAQGTGLSVFVYNTTTLANGTTLLASAANQHLAVNTGGTGLVFSQPAMVLVTTIPISSQLTAGNPNIFTAPFINYLIQMDNIVPATNSALQLRLQVGTTGTSFVTSSTYFDSVANNTTATAIVIVSVSTAITSAAGYGVNGVFNVFNPTSATTFKHFTGYPIAAFLNNGLTAPANTVLAFWNGATTAVRGFQIQLDTGNMATGFIKVFGYA